MTVKPPRLEPGDLIGIAAPASCFSREAFDRGVLWLEARGFRTCFREDIFARHHYLAGSISRRVEELQALIDNPEAKAIFFARGGYGLLQVLPHLDIRGLAHSPKLLLGHSDLTPLLNRVVQTLGLTTFHGPLVAGFDKTCPDSLTQFLEVVCGTGRSLRLSSDDPDFCVARGTARAPVCGGNLTLIAATLGTPFDLDTRGRILCIEEVGERPYRVDRLLQQIELAGKLRDVRGIAIGQMTACEEPGGGGRPLLEIFQHFFSTLGIPVVSGLPFGHGRRNLTFPLGVDAELNADEGTLEFLGSPVS